MTNLLKSITEFFSQKSSEPVGLCSFEHLKEVKTQTNVSKPSKKREMRLSELME